MNQFSVYSHSNASLDWVGGPNIRQDGLDFSLLFEESLFAILPAGLMLCAVPWRLWTIYKRPDIVTWSGLRIVKLTTVLALCLLKLAQLVLWTLPEYTQLRTRATIAAAALDLAATLAIGLLSPLEHSKSLRPSILLSTILLFNTVLDIVRARTEWNLLGSSAISIVFVAALAVKVLLMMLEAFSKTRYTELLASPEQSSGIYSLSLYAWLNPLIYRGNQGDLKVEDLYPVDSDISAANVQDWVRVHWATSTKDKSWSLAWAITKALSVPIGVTMIPRLVLTLFSIAQPFLIEATLQYVEAGKAADKYGFGLIGAFGFTYLGITISTAWYQYLTARALAMIRAALMTIIYESSLDNAAGSIDSSSPISMMGADVERVVSRLRWVISTAPNIIQVAAAIWILQYRLGWICVAPILVAISCAYASSEVAKTIRPRQRQWMHAVQKRVAFTSDVLGSMKGMKMLGLTDVVTQMVQELRDSELSISKSFRYVQICNITLGNAANMLSPVVTFIGFGLITRYAFGTAPNASIVFSSLSLLSILISPVNELVAAIPNLSSALESCNRIQEYATSRKSSDSRFTMSDDSARHTESAYGTFSNSVDMIEFKHVTSGWSQTNTVLRDITAKFHAGSLNVVFGPVGCGKSTLLQNILGEGLVTAGSITVSTDSIAYCDQSPFLRNQSIRDNILSNLEYDPEWYDSCLRACALDIDIQAFQDQDRTLVGSKGISLSGGQKQRSAIARAVYARKKIVLLDDCFSGLDVKTERHCFDHLLSHDGLLRQSGTIVVLVTHARKWLPHCDQEIVLDFEGRLEYVGVPRSIPVIPETLREGDMQPTRGAEPAIDQNQQGDVNERDGESQHENNNSVEGRSSKDRGQRDPSNLLFYITAMGRWQFALFVSLVALQVIFTAIQPLWLSWWVDANGSGHGVNLGKWLGVYAVLGMLAVTFLGISGGFFLVKLIPNSARSLHLLVLKSTMRAPMSFISKTDPGSLLNRFAQDMTLLDMDLPMSLLLFSNGLGHTIASAIMTCISSGTIAFSIPILGIVLYYLQKIYLQTSRQMRLLDLEAKSPLHTHLTETLDGIRTIRAFGWNQQMIEQNNELLDLAQRPFYLLLCLQNWLTLVLDIIVTCLAVILITLIVTFRDSVQSGLLGVALVSIVTFSQTLATFVNYWTSLETSLGAVARTRQFVAETPNEDDNGITNAQSDWSDVSSIEFRNVSAAYSPSGPKVLSSIQLKIESGQRVAVCGRTGSGKSSLVALLLRLLDPSSGALMVRDEDISVLTPESIRQRLNTLPQEPWFLPHRYSTVRSNLDPLQSATDAQLHDALERSRLMEHVTSAGGLEAGMDQLHLSAGQKQLFCLARAMVIRNRSKILLLDEATSSVDTSTEELMMSLLRTEFSGHTIIAVMHRLSHILDFDRVLLLHQGHMIEYDDPHKLLQSPESAFAQLYHGQQ